VKNVCYISITLQPTYEALFYMWNT
jgi:hypothetical protein